MVIVKGLLTLVLWSAFRKKDEQIGIFTIFQVYVTVAVYFMYFESIIMHRRTCSAHYESKKAYNIHINTIVL